MKNIVKIKKPRNKIDKFFSEFKKVIYKVTDNFGNSSIGELREAYLIAEGEDTVLLYHPSNDEPYILSSFEICRIQSDEIYVSCENVKEPYVNVIKFCLNKNAKK